MSNDDGAFLRMNLYQTLAKQTDQYNPATRLMALLAGLADEAGEVNGAWSKHLRGDEAYKTDEQLRDAIKKELGDVLWFVAMIADEIGISLSDVASANIAKLKDRYERGVIKGDGDDR